jgi:hypothetical protein
MVDPPSPWNVLSATSYTIVMQTRTARTLATGLGWFSIGLGVAELVAPRAFTRALGVRDRPGLTRALYGLREIGVGVSVLRQGNPAPWLWARVAGDALDLGTLANVLRKRDVNVAPAMVALGAVLGVTALDVYVANRLSDA